jgi:hypothetical protein
VETAGELVALDPGVFRVDASDREVVAVVGAEPPDVCRLTGWALDSWAAEE